MRDAYRARYTPRGERGFAVMLVLLVIALLTVLGVALTMTAVMNSQKTVSSDFHQRAYNTAESGVADVMTQLGNNSISSAVSGMWENTNTFPSQQDLFESYDYNVTFNNSLVSTIVVPDPLTTTGGLCGSVSSPGFGCVTIPQNGVLIAVRGHYGQHVAYAESEAVDAKFSLDGNTLFTKNNAGTNGNGAIASDPCINVTCPAGVSSSHNVEVYTDGSFNGGKGLIDGDVNSVGTATANVPNGCSPACTATSGATAMPFPSSNDIIQAENTWKLDAENGGHYYSSTSTLPSSIDVASGSTWFIDQSVDLKNVAITNEGGIVVVTGAITESGNKTAANYALSSACNTNCDCHGEAQLISLSPSGMQLHGQGTGSGHLISQGLLFAPNGPVSNIGNATIQAAIIASSAQIGGSGGMTADACAAGLTGKIDTYGYNITSYGEH